MPHHLHVHGPDLFSNAVYIQQTVPTGAQLWLQGPNHHDVISANWASDDYNNRMISDVVSTITRRETPGDHSGEVPLAFVVVDPPKSWFTECNEAIREVIGRGENAQVQLAVSTREPVEWLEKLDVEVVDISDPELIAEISLDLAEQQQFAPAANLLAAKAQVYMTKALLQQLRSSSSNAEER